MSAAGGPPTEIVKNAPKAVAKTKAASFRSLLESSKAQFKAALPKHIDVDRLLRVFMTTVQRTPALLDCTQESLLGCLFQCAQLGLEPDGLLGHAYLIPFKDKKNNRILCTLIIGYKGLLKLARQSNEIQSVSARVVYSNDLFEYEFGLEDKLVHKPVHGDPGEMVYAYCIFRYKDGGHHFDVMSKVEIDAIRARSMASDSGPWVTDYDEMAKKTVLRRTSKMAPASIEDLARAVAIDGRSEAGLPPMMDILMPAPELPGSAPEEQGRRLSLSRKEDVIDNINPNLKPLTDEVRRKSDEHAAKAEAAAQGEFVISIPKQRREIAIAAAEAHLDLDDVAGWYGKRSIDELSRDDADDALAKIRSVNMDTPEPDEPGTQG